MMSLLEFSLEIGEDGWVHPKGANILPLSVLSYRNNLVGTWRAISVLFGINRVRNKRFHLVEPPFPVLKARFSGWCF